MAQLTLPFDMPDIQTKRRALIHDSFSYNNDCVQEARLELEVRYKDIIEETDKFNRQLVSFQANKTETLHNWFKYREGFSAQLVELLLNEFDIAPGQTILDPFAGSCTTMLVAKMIGINAIGIELLPHCHLAWEAKSKAFIYNVDELTHIYGLIKETNPPLSHKSFTHLTITESAFPAQSEQLLMDYDSWFRKLDISNESKVLCKAILMSILEEISYTRKDGQYLRWDGRAAKLVERNKSRVLQGKKPLQGIHKGELQNVRQALLAKLNKVRRDIVDLQQRRPINSHQDLVHGNVLYTLPTIESDQFHSVITSPPYANRYDYTRTYALELAYLNVHNNIFQMRQNLLSCTVENKSKEADLETFYQSIDQHKRYERIKKIICNNASLHEVRQALQVRNKQGHINNRGVLRMIDQYFEELTFVYAELYRTCKSNAHVAFVNDNVRYAGEIIPIDTICTNLAEQVGFKPVKIYVLPQRKGNSSQQMGRFGRQELRKSITIWKKP